MSALESAGDRLAEELRTLEPRAQAAVLACASKGLLPHYQAWCSGADVADRSPLHREVSDAVRSYVTSRDSNSLPDLLEELERATPEEPTDVPWATAAQDCFILLDSSVRVCSGTFSGEDAAWYLIEPMGQAVSERLYGVTDVGSRAEAAEAEVVRDPAFAQLMSDVSRAIDELRGVTVLSDTAWQRCEELLRSVGPELG